MIYLNEFLNLVNFQITGGSEYLWKCFGPNARYLDSELDNYSLSCIFDTKTQELYTVDFCYNVNDENTEAYRWINPKYKEALFQESEERNVDPTNYCDEVQIVDFENLHELVSIVDSLCGFTKYTTMSLDLNEDVILFLSQKAMELNVTMDVLVCNILRDHLQKLEQNPETT